MRRMVIGLLVCICPSAIAVDEKNDRHKSLIRQWCEQQIVFEPTSYTIISGDRTANFDGRHAIAKDMSISVHLDWVDGRTYAMSFSTVSIANRPTRVKDHVALLRGLMLALVPQGREVGAVIVDFQDGLVAVENMFGSNIHEIEGSAVKRAYTRTGVYRRGKVANRVLEVHFHPRDLDADPDYIGPSPVDFQAYQLQLSQLRRYHPNVEFEALIVPMGSVFQDDLAFHITEADIAGFHQVNRK
jgi:hypothetical protein